MEKLPKKKIIVTGASGFIGARLMELLHPNYDIQPLSLRGVSVADLPLAGVDCIIHLAGKAHDIKNAEEKPYFDINYELTSTLAERAIEENVAHFIYISTVKVYGEPNGDAFDEHSICKPQDAYGKSKLLAEEYLQSVESSDFKVAIVRPPMVYGPHAKGNIIKLMELASRPYPLPLANIRNQRSLVFIDNLIALIAHIVDQQAFGVFVAGDERPVSSSFLIQTLQKELGKLPRLFTLPTFLRQLIRYSKPALYERLFGSFVVENVKTNQQLDYQPPYTTEYGIAKMVEWYKNDNAQRIL